MRIISTIVNSRSFNVKKAEEAVRDLKSDKEILNFAWALKRIDFNFNEFKAFVNDEGKSDRKAHRRGKVAISGR